jgi:hypothetical protein
MHPPAQFRPGFRMSLLDGAILILGTIGTFWLYTIDRNLALVVAFTVGHFFIFCNIVRMARQRELIWALAFATMGSASALTGTPTWNLTFLAALAVTGVVVWLELRSPSYHGILWQRINPQLRIWWSTNAGTNS